jgi:hypothetical protein
MEKTVVLQKNTEPFFLNRAKKNEINDVIDSVEKN